MVKIQFVLFLILAGISLLFAEAAQAVATMWFLMCVWRVC